MQIVRIFSNDIGMEFGIQECAMVEMKRGKMIQSEGIDLPMGQQIKLLGREEGYRYLGILESDKIKSAEMKNMLRKEYFHSQKDLKI